MSPCNTPILFSKKSVRLPLTHTQLFTSSYIDLIMRNNLPSIPNLNILYYNAFLSTVSNALLKSTNVQKSLLPFANLKSTILFKTYNASTVLQPFLNPYCALDITLFSSAHLCNLLFRIREISFAKQLSRVMPL